MRIGPIMPGEHPIEMLAECLAHAFDAKMGEIIKELQDGDAALRYLLRDKKKVHKENAFLLAIDQFEELFTFADAGERRHFDRLLGAALEDPECPLFVVSTVRSDFLDRFTEDLPRLVGVRNRQGRPWTLEPIGDAGLREVIDGPARLARIDASDVRDWILGAAWRRGHSTNLVGVPTGELASVAFNNAAGALHVAGAREQNAHMFRILDRSASPDDAALIFEHYMAVMFGLQAPLLTDTNGRRRYRASYLRLLRGWAFDSNGAEGAVLKGWVESRFGLLPTYHKEKITRFTSTAWSRYVEEKMASRFHNNAIYSQLDLVYEFAQWSLRRKAPENHHLRLFRGILDFAEHQIIERLDRRRLVLRLNNLVSFTADRSIPSWFGDYILEATVPVCKVLFFDDLLQKHALKGEGEVLAIGRLSIIDDEEQAHSSRRAKRGR